MLLYNVNTGLELGSNMFLAEGNMRN